MIHLLIAITGFSCCAVIYCLRKSCYWHNRYVNSGISIELEFATQQQIIDELRSRPNSGFLLLEPVSDKDGGIVVTTHAWNLQPEVILASLKAAHDGMVSYLGVESPKNENEEA